MHFPVLIVLLLLVSAVSANFFPFFPPGLAFINSNYQFTTQAPNTDKKTVLGVWHYSNETAKTHCTINQDDTPANGIVEQWVAEHATTTEFWVLLKNGECHHQRVSNPHLNCTAWETHGALSSRHCYGLDQAVTIRAKVLRGQIASVVENATISGQKATVTIQFKDTNAKPPSPSVFTPPATCSTSKRSEEDVSSWMQDYNAMLHIARSFFYNRA
eukprot:TRINITY_DN13117_c0_g1_i1.p1 TRINITY_DN13117_c0_g1~~TRINITY_DN13117_c0_g1_i1.p1  ORF type:complete len:215 (-),score=39.46 TRINITY_DN13117_c0_g1_i1:22-666(-)